MDHTRLISLLTISVVTAAGFLMSGCADDSYASAEGKSPPYIRKEGCRFTIIGENGSAGITSPEATGVADESVSLSISFGDYEIAVSNCELVRNSHGLPVYED